MPPTQCNYEASAGSDTECHVAPEVPPESYGMQMSYIPPGYYQQGVAGGDATMQKYLQAAMATTSNAPVPQTYYQVPPTPATQPLTVQTNMQIPAAQPVTWPPQHGGNMFQPIVSPESLNVNAQPFQPSGNNSATTTASNSPIHFASQQPLAVQIPPHMYPAYPVPGAQAMYGPISDPNLQYHQYVGYPWAMMLQGSAPVPQFQPASSSNGSSPAPAYQVSPYHGSPAPQMPQVAPVMPQAQSFAQYQDPTTIPLVNGLNHLELTNAPMVRPKKQNLDQPSDMRSKWHGDFDNLFCQFGDAWELHACPEGINDKADGIYPFEDSAKIRFICRDCANAWTSMQGRVKFWHHFDQDTRRGSVFFQLFGQKCKKCKENRNSHDMQDPLWYPDEITKVVTNIHSVIGSKYYGMELARISIHRRAGHPKGQHDPSLCHACEKGICRRSSPNPNK